MLLTLYHFVDEQGISSLAVIDCKLHFLLHMSQYLVGLHYQRVPKGFCGIFVYLLPLWLFPCSPSLLSLDGFWKT
jgi:hypothetical protein